MNYVDSSDSEFEFFEFVNNLFIESDTVVSFFKFVDEIYGINSSEILKNILISWERTFDQSYFELQRGLSTLCAEEKQNFVYYRYDYLFLFREFLNCVNFEDDSTQSDDLYDKPNLNFSILINLWWIFFSNNFGGDSEEHNQVLISISSDINNYIKNISDMWELPDLADVLLLDEPFIESGSEIESNLDIYEGDSLIINNAKNMHLALTNISLTITIADLEHLFGSRIILNIRGLDYHCNGSIYNVLCFTYEGIFKKIGQNMFLDCSTISVAFLYAGLTYDFDLLVDCIKDIFDTRQFTISTNLYKFFYKTFLFYWGFYKRHCFCVGLLFKMSGKFSKQLLTKARELKLSLGDYSFGKVENSITYRYRQTNSESGAYGLKLYVSQKNVNRF